MSAVLSMDCSDGLYTVEWERGENVITSIIATRTSVVGDAGGVHELDVEAWEYHARRMAAHPPQDVLDEVARAERERQLELRRPARSRGL